MFHKLVYNQFSGSDYIGYGLKVFP